RPVRRQALRPHDNFLTPTIGSETNEALDSSPSRSKAKNEVRSRRLVAGRLARGVGLHEQLEVGRQRIFHLVEWDSQFANTFVVEHEVSLVELFENPNVPLGEALAVEF